MTDAPQNKPVSKKSEMLEVRLTYETKQSFLAACRTAGRTASDVVRCQIEAFVAEQANPAPPMVVPPRVAPTVIPERGPERGNVVAFIPKPLRKPGLIAAGVGALGLAVMAALPTAAAQNFKSTFEQLDTNKDGMLSADEFAAAPAGKQVTIRPLKKLPAGTTVPHLPVAGEKQVVFILPHADNPPKGQTAMHQSFEPKLAPTMEQVRRATFALTDTDGDGKVSLAEYMARQTAALANGFEQLDADHDGALTAEEYGKLNAAVMAWPVDMDVRFPTTVSVGQPVSDEAMKANFAKLDKNGDGKVSRDEYMPKN